MTMNVLLGHTAVHPHAAGRCQRDADADTKPGHAFSDLVGDGDSKHGKTDRVRARDTGTKDDGGRPLDYYVARLDMRAAPEASEAAEAVMDIVPEDIPADDGVAVKPAIEELPDAEPDMPAEQTAGPALPQATDLPVANEPPVDGADERPVNAADAARAAEGRPTAAPDGRPARATDDGDNRRPAATPVRTAATARAEQAAAQPMPRDERTEGRREPPADATAGRNARPAGGERPVQPTATPLPAAPDSGGGTERDGAKPAVSTPLAEVSRPASSPAFDAAPARPNPFTDQNAAPFAGKVNVLGFSAAAAPAPVAMLGATSAGLVAAMEADPTWRAAAAEPAPGTVRTPNFASGVNTLRIQLHPAELGMVTARLTVTGSQLQIEIRAESNDARQRLANDSDAIVKALRAVGLDVEKLTIQQGNASSTNANQSGSGARDQHLAGQQMQSDGDGRDRGNRQPATREGEDAAAGPPADMAAHRARGDVYI